MAAQPYSQTMPDYKPTVLLPEPDYIKEVREIVYDGPDRGAKPPQWAGATSMWIDGGVPSSDYMSWSQLYVIARPGNGASYLQPPTGDRVTINTNPTLETMLLEGDETMSKYQKRWTCPQPIGALYITEIRNPDYTNTDASVPYPGPQSVVYFKTPSGQTGNFSMATETWTFDPTTP